MMRKVETLIEMQPLVHWKERVKIDLDVEFKVTFRQ
jgi:hypothetical protein